MENIQINLNNNNSNNNNGTERDHGAQEAFTFSFISRSMCVSTAMIISNDCAHAHTSDLTRSHFVNGG